MNESETIAYEQGGTALSGLLARLVDGAMVREGDTVVVADTAVEDPAAGPDGSHHEPAVRYQVLCRTHYRHGDLGPATPAVQPQLEFG